jgi:tripartite-type tricarboxylate transporter receptor subunit TctC
MNEQTTRLLNAVLKLPDDQRNAFVQALRQYLEAPEYQKRTLRESFSAQVTKMQTGPLGGSTCPLCGR